MCCAVCVLCCVCAVCCVYAVCVQCVCAVCVCVLCVCVCVSCVCVLCPVYVCACAVCEALHTPHPSYSSPGLEMAAKGLLSLLLAVELPAGSNTSTCSSSTLTTQ